jgi:DNA polymerase-3 subunit alpha
MDSMALTDHGALYGAVAFYQAARSKGIKPIIGVETYVARRSMTDKEGKADAQPFHLILGPDLVGYRNLCRLVTDAHIDALLPAARSTASTWPATARGSSAVVVPGGEIQGAQSTTGSSPASSPASTATSSGRTASTRTRDHGMPDQRR